MMENFIRRLVSNRTVVTVALLLFPAFLVLSCYAALTAADVLWFQFNLYVAAIVWITIFIFLIALSTLYGRIAMIYFAMEKSRSAGKKGVPGFEAFILVVWAFLIAFCLWLGGMFIRAAKWEPVLSKWYVDYGGVEPRLADLLEKDLPLILVEGQAIDTRVVGTYLRMVPRGAGVFKVNEVRYPSEAKIPVKELPVSAPIWARDWGDVIEKYSAKELSFPATVQWPAGLHVDQPVIIYGYYRVPILIAEEQGIGFVSRDSFTNERDEIALLPDDGSAKIIKGFVSSRSTLKNRVGGASLGLLIAYVLASFIGFGLGEYWDKTA